MKKLLIAATMLSLLLAACTLPNATDATPTETISPEEIAQTIVAQTQTAEAAAVTQTPLPPTNTATPEGTATSAITTVTVSVATNCRTGPDVAYPLVLVFQPGASAEVVGKYSATNYWIIKTPTDETCWLWGEYATVQGDTSTLPEMAAPPAPVVEVSPTPTATQEGLIIVPGVIILTPPAPESFSAVANCQVLDTGLGQILQSKMDKLTWSSVANATGYKIYVDGVEERDLGGGAVSITLDALELQPTNYGIKAYNANGESTMKTIPEPSCP